MTYDATEVFSTHDAWVAAYLIAKGLPPIRAVSETRNGTDWVRFDFPNRTEAEHHWHDFRSGLGSTAPQALRQAYYRTRDLMRAAKSAP